ncbi:MAG: DNA primase [Rickettsiales bacterium]
MKFSQSFIDDLKSRYRLSEVIGKAVPIKRAGREFHALCPFHKEKTPSFTINDEKGFFHCFGCGAHGDVIGFTMDYERLSYPEAIERLATQAGMQLPTYSKAEVEREEQARGLQYIVETACSWFEEQFDQSAEGELARKYARERGLNQETLAKFRMGYAPADRDALSKAMREKGITQAQLIEAGLLINVEDKTPYSRFRRRLIFPIRDRKSKVVAFGGRVLPGEPNAEAPKYLNSPETPLFHKGRMLFNLDFARRSAIASGELTVCEGYMDVIVLAQAGIEHAVAPLGTAVTPEQLQLCWQLVGEPVMCLDGDSAGARAMTRVYDLALPLLVPGKTLRFAQLPQGEDPDSLIRIQGVDAMLEVLKRAEPLSEVLWNQVMGQEARTPEAKAQQEAQLMQRITQIKHPTVQHYYKQFMRDKLRVQQQPAAQPKFVPYQKGKPQQQQPQGVSAPPAPFMPRDAEGALVTPVAKLIALVMTHPPLLQDANAEEAWLSVPLPSVPLAKLHGRITEAHIEYPALSAQALDEMLREDALEIKLIEAALKDLGIARAGDEAGRVMLAQRLWPEVMNDIDRLRLKADIAEAQRAYETELSEENQQRVIDLKTQLDHVELERTRFYREDPVG